MSVTARAGGRSSIMRTETLLADIQRHFGLGSAEAWALLADLAAVLEGVERPRPRGALPLAVRFLDRAAELAGEEGVSLRLLSCLARAGIPAEAAAESLAWLLGHLRRSRMPGLPEPLPAQVLEDRLRELETLLAWTQGARRHQSVKAHPAQKECHGR